MKISHRIEESSLTIIGKLPYLLNKDKEIKQFTPLFMVGYFIINTMAIRHENRTMIYRGQLAHLCNMSERNITSITNKLHEIGVVVKAYVGDEEKGKTYNYYQLNWEKIDEFFAQLNENDERFLSGSSHLKKERTKEHKKERTQEQLSDGEILKKLSRNGEFEVACSASSNTREDSDLPF